MCKLDKAWSMLKISTQECLETNGTLQRVEDFYAAFEQREDSKDIQRDNYTRKQAVID